MFREQRGSKAARRYSKRSIVPAVSGDTICAENRHIVLFSANQFSLKVASPLKKNTGCFNRSSTPYTPLTTYTPPPLQSPTQSGILLIPSFAQNQPISRLIPGERRQSQHTLVWAVAEGGDYLSM